MRYECRATRDYSDEEVDRINAIKARERPPVEHHLPELAELTVDRIVVEHTHSSLAEVRDLPLSEFYYWLIDAQATSEAAPALMEHDEAENKRKAEEKEKAAKRNLC